jgi:hypothetical protein
MTRPGALQPAKGYSGSLQPKQAEKCRLSGLGGLVAELSLVGYKEMAKLKFFTTHMMTPDGQVEAVVAARSKKQAAILYSMSISSFNSWCSETGNAKQIEAASRQPGVVFAKPLDDTKADYVPRPDLTGSE